MIEPGAKATAGRDSVFGLSSPWLAIIEQAPMPMAMVEGSAHIVRYVNSVFSRLMEKGREELVGKPFCEVLPETDHAVTTLNRVYCTGQAESHTEQQDGSPYSILWSYAMWPVMSDDGPVGVMVLVTQTAQFHERAIAMNEALILGAVRQHELTEAADASNANLAATDIAKNHFIAVLSHELRSPLNTILLWSQILQRPSRTDDSLRAGLQIIYRSSKALTQFIDELLDVHRVAFGKLGLEVTEVDLAEILRSVVDSMAAAATEKEVCIVREIDIAPIVVSGDSTRLQQVFGNLLGNAIKFTPRGGEIRVVLRRKGTRAEARMSDTGEGISAAGLPHVFERFRQDDPLASSTHGGLGLGLTIAKELVELHWGTITAESPGKGGGAVFTVTLPLLARKGRTHSARTSAEGVVAERPPSLGGLLVLVVDDEPDTQVALRLILEEADAESIVAGSADEALDVIKERRPNVIVSDIGMPGRNGYELLRAIRALPATRGGRIPAIALTAYATSEDRERALSAGFQTHLAKPVEPGTLISAIAALASLTPSGPAGNKRVRKNPSARDTRL